MQLLRTGLTLLLSLAPLTAFGAAKLEVGRPLSNLVISGEHGGIVKDGGAWDSATMKGTLNFFVYVDPDDSDINDALVDRMKEENFDHDKFHSVAVINMAATWKPNVIIMKVLKGKQEKFPRTTYVFDKDRYAAQNWGLTPEGYHVLLVDRDGSLLYEKTGKLDKAEIDSFISLIKSKLNIANASATPGKTLDVSATTTPTEAPKTAPVEEVKTK